MRHVSLKDKPVTSGSTRPGRLIWWARAVALHTVILGTALSPHGLVAQSAPKAEIRSPVLPVPAPRGATPAPLGVLAEQPASTRRMIDMIQQIYRSVDM